MAKGGAQTRLRGRRVEWSVSSFARSLLAIVAALLLGLLIDQFFEQLFPHNRLLLRIGLQFAVILIVVALLEDRLPRLLPFDLVNDVIFVSIFLGVQQYLFHDIGRLHLLPWPPHIKATAPSPSPSPLGAQQSTWFRGTQALQ